MPNFIEDFYYGNIDPHECTAELKTSVKKTLNTLVSKEKELTETLTGDDKKRFLDYVDTYINFLSIFNTDSFIAGFRLGARFTYDTFVKSNS